MKVSIEWLPAEKVLRLQTAMMRSISEDTHFLYLPVGSESSIHHTTLEID